MAVLPLHQTPEDSEIKNKHNPLHCVLFLRTSTSAIRGRWLFLLQMLDERKSSWMMCGTIKALCRTFDNSLQREECRYRKASPEKEHKNPTRCIGFVLPPLRCSRRTAFEECDNLETQIRAVLPVTLLRL